MAPKPGSRGDRILSGMRALAKTTFSTQELADFAGLSWGVRDAHVAVNRLVKQGLVVRVSAALYTLPDRTPALIDLLVWRVNTKHWCLSHRTAMAVHGFGPPRPHATLMV